MKQVFLTAQSEKAGCTGLILAESDEHGIHFVKVTINIPKVYTGHETSLIALKKNLFPLDEIMVDLESLFNDETESEDATEL